jgi:serine/threonine-protein kinase
MDRPPSTAEHPTGPADPPAPSLDLTGRVLGDFKVLRRLGVGGMGEVYLAEQISLKRKVALKILRPELAANPASLARFKTEAEAVAQATHANIVQVYFTGEADGIWYIALEYVEGRNLREYLARKGPPELFLALSIMRQVAAALQRAGELGIIHRDVKPENILLTRKGEAKVADFGLSRCLGEGKPALNLTQSGVTMGTPLYMSPEQVEGKPLDCRTDIYSFGVTCYHMLAGHPPYEGGSPFEVALLHVRGTPKPLQEIRPDLPPGLCAAVHKMMAREPDQRFQTGRELLRELVRLREGLNSSSTAAVTPRDLSVELVPAPLPPSSGTLPAVGTSSSLPAPRPRRGWLFALFLLTVLLALAGGVGFGWLRRQGMASSPSADNVPARDAYAEEKALRNLVESYLKEGRSGDVDFGLRLCQELGVLYFNQNRLDDAEELYRRLERHEILRYQFLGKLGRAVALGLHNDPAKARESAELFKALGQVFQRPDPKRPPTGDAVLARLLQNAPFKEYVVKALRNDVRNGASADGLPDPLKPLLPRDKDKGGKN